MPPTAWGESEWKLPIPEIVRAWSSYRSTARDFRPDSAPAPSAVWSAVEQRLWPAYDLTGGFGATADAVLLNVRPAGPPHPNEYVIRTLYSAVLTDTSSAPVPVGVVRLYAAREDGRWVLANALPRITRGWERRRVGPIEYVVQPGHVFDGVKARQARKFADSIAQVFSVPPLDSLTYYVTDSPEEMYRLLGFEWLPLVVGGAGMAVVENRQLFSGDPVFGENHRHELTHMVLYPLLKQGGAHRVMWEGLATWLGGTVGLTAEESRRAFAEYLRSHPEATLDSLFSGTRDAGFRPGGAVLCRMVYEAGGVAALKSVLTTGPSDDQLREALERQLGLSWKVIAERWRADATKAE